MDSAALWSPTSTSFDALSLIRETASLRARRWSSGASDGNAGSGTGTGGRGCPSTRAATTEPMVCRTTSAALISRTSISFDSVSPIWTTASARAATRSSGRSDGYLGTSRFPTGSQPHRRDRSRSQVRPGSWVGGNGLSPSSMVTCRGLGTCPPRGPRSTYSPGLFGISPGF